MMKNLFMSLMGILLTVSAYPQGVEGSFPLERLETIAYQTVLNVMVLHKGTQLPTGFEQYQTQPPTPSYSVTTLLSAARELKQEVSSNKKMLDATIVAITTLKSLKRIEELRKSGVGNYGSYATREEASEYNRMVDGINSGQQQLGQQLIELRKDAEARVNREGMKMTVLILLTFSMGALLGKILDHSASQRGGLDYWKGLTYLALVAGAFVFSRFGARLEDGTPLGFTALFAPLSLSLVFGLVAKVMSGTRASMRRFN